MRRCRLDSRWMAGMVGALLLVSACSASNGASDPDAAPIATAAAPAAPSSTTSTTTTTTTTATFDSVPSEQVDQAPVIGAEVSDGPLVEVCPEVVSVQISATPSPAVGALYRLVGSEPTVDETGSTVSGLIERPDGTVEDVRLEIRSGGPAVGFEPALSLQRDDPSVLLAQASTAEVAIDSTGDATTVAVVTLTEQTHQAFVWDPAAFPEVVDVAGLADAGAEIRHVSGSPVVEFLVANGALDPDQATPGSDGGPAAFVAAQGDIAQLGDLLIDPALFESLPQWARPVEFATPRPQGWTGYDDMLIVRRDALDSASACLGRLVPIVQAAVVAYAGDPSTTNAVMASVRALANPLNRVTTEMMDAGVAAGRDAEVFSNGPNDTVGDFDGATFDGFVESLDIDPSRVLFTNDFLDPSIGF